MTKLLIASYLPTGLVYVEKGKSEGMHVRVLDCIDVYHKQLHAQFGDATLHTPGRKSDVLEKVSSEQFDIAIVEEDIDYVQTALITKTLREAGIPAVFVIAKDPSKRSMFRRCGAHRVITHADPHQAWAILKRYLPACLPA